MRDYSRRLRYEIHQLDRQRYYVTRGTISKVFGLVPTNMNIDTPGEVFKVYIKGLRVISLEWEPDAGFVVVAKNKRAEPLLHKIANYLEKTIEI